MNTTTLVLMVVSPLLVALIRRCSWPKEAVELVAVLVVVVLFVAGRALDHALTWPLGSSFWVELLTYFGVQQAAYKFVWRNSPATRTLENVGNS